MLVADELVLSDKIFGLTLRLVELSFRPNNCFASVDGPGLWADDSDETLSDFLIETELASATCVRKISFINSWLYLSSRSNLFFYNRP